MKLFSKVIFISSFIAMTSFSSAFARPPGHGPHPGPGHGPGPHPGPGHGPGWGYGGHAGHPWNHGHGGPHYASGPITTSTCFPSAIEERNELGSQLDILNKDIQVGAVTSLEDMGEGALKDLFENIKADNDLMLEVDQLPGSSEIERLAMKAFIELK